MTDNFNDKAGEVNLLRVIRAFQDETFAKTNCMRIGIIKEVISTDIVKCLITNKKLMGTNNDGSSIWRNYPPIFARIFYLGSGGNGSAFPLTTDSPCLLLFNDREFDSFFKTGQISALNDTRMHSLTDAVCIPLFRPKQVTTYDIVGDNIDIIANNTLNFGAKTINLTGEQININGTLIINGTPFSSHKHSNGNEGKDTGGVV